MSAEPVSGSTPVYTEQLFYLFKGLCGSCHVGPGQGGFNVSQSNFAQTVNQKALDLIRSNDRAKFMPPLAAGGLRFSDRPSNDPVVELAKQLDQWISQGRPSTLFTIPSEDPGSASFALTPAVGTQMTNVGDCIPSKGLIATSPETMDQLDAMFASATELPQTLAETDMTTLDAETLARQGVIAYAPQYPLWTDDAGKLRYIRVPRGTSVRFDKTAQRFEIPPNTRFYKTFLKEVIDRDGNKTFRKMETRVIVSRPDETQADGTVVNRALYGTYLWSDDELSTTLSNVPLNDGSGFTDRLLEYTLDEPRAQMIIDSKPANLDFALEGATGLKRHYAVPGSPRCVQCHMGSPSDSFILGFIPLQVLRRPDGVGGAYEGTGADELNQLQRFIDYGLVTGLTSPADIVPLEKAEGNRAPRNDHELMAQAYLLGNCAHCHNPRGFPSVKNPVLKDSLNFMPGPGAGIYQFPLEQKSPLRSRGIDQNIDIPYITPSLREYPVDSGPTLTWTPKWAAYTCDGQTASEDPIGNWLCMGRTDHLRIHYDAPWRSLIYRNVDTPFMYADDLAIFPHMPMNSPGLDCRAPQILGDWMVSIPAVRKMPQVREDAIPNPKEPFDTSPQPYVEVLPTDPGYAQAREDAEQRLRAYHGGVRYNFCPDSSDILDPTVVHSGGQQLVPSDDIVADPAHPGQPIQPGMGVPNHAHWVLTDVTDVRGDWYPRRIDWEKIVVDQMPETNPDLESSEHAQLLRQFVIEELQKVTWSDDLKALALTEVPFGLWQPNPACDFSSEPKVSDFSGSARPPWMDLVEPPPTASAPVYMQAPGASIFSNICINCHGPQADSRGLLADAISNMTGGTGRVANFRAGLFGPPLDPDANRTRIFGPFAKAAPTATSAGDWAARYLSWMALGGTLVRIPPALLNIVATTKIVGAARKNLVATASPNMLKLAQSLCMQVLPEDNTNHKLDRFFFQHGTFNWSEVTSLIGSNGDADLWRRVCSFKNRNVVRVPQVSWREGTPPTVDGEPTLKTDGLYYAQHEDGSVIYPADAPVLDDHGHVVKGVQTDNLFPMCMQKPTDSQKLAALNEYLAANPVGGAGGSTIPYCPDALFKDPTSRLASRLDSVTGQPYWSDAERWSIHGAINAGFMVFTYLDQLARGKVTPLPAYNHCEQRTSR